MNFEELKKKCGYCCKELDSNNCDLDYHDICKESVDFYNKFSKKDGIISEYEEISDAVEKFSKKDVTSLNDFIDKYGREKLVMRIANKLVLDDNIRKRLEKSKSNYSGFSIPLSAKDNLKLTLGGYAITMSVISFAPVLSSFLTNTVSCAPNGVCERYDPFSNMVTSLYAVSTVIAALLTGYYSVKNRLEKKKLTSLLLSKEKGVIESWIDLKLENIV
ncbi:MAG: hypothetical protein GON13_03740 [Nanoarchaeota archaeon]|nr:hypothetical protein [Nanoarchaeota archaeon]